MPKWTKGPRTRENALADSHERVKLECGCVNLIDGLIEYCPTHAAAPEMAEHIIRWTNVYHHTHDRDAGTLTDFWDCEAAGCSAARALLARIEGK